MAARSEARERGAKRRRSGRARRGSSPRAALRRFELLYLVGALALFGLMFATWYGSEVSGQAEGVPFGGTGSGGNAWQTLEVIPLFLMLAIATAVGAALLRISGSDWKPAIPPNAAVTVLGGLATLLILIRIVFPPGFGDLGGIGVEATVKVGIFFALAATFAIAYGGYRAMRAEGDSFQKIAQRLETGRPSGRKRDPEPKEKAEAEDAKPKPSKPAARLASKRRSRSSSD